MRPVTQSKRGGPNERPEERGDCFTACLASILEVDLADVPVPHVDDWWDVAQDAVRQHGYRLVYIGGDETTGTGAELGEWLGPVYWIAGVPSLNLGTYQDGRPVGHVVVMRGPELVHDPSLGERYPLGRLTDDVPVDAAMLLVQLEPRSAGNGAAAS